MVNKKQQATPGTVQFNKLIAELPEKREKIKAQVQFRHDLLESQRVNYNNEFDRLHGSKKTDRVRCQRKNKNARITKESKAIIKWRTISSYLFNEILIYCNIYRDGNIP